MNNSLLNSLPALHGTMLGITLAFVGAFLLYAYDKTSSARQKLEDLKRQVQEACKPDYEVDIDRAKYLNSEGELDWRRVMHGLRDASSLFGHIGHEDQWGIREIIIIDDIRNGSTQDPKTVGAPMPGLQTDAKQIKKSDIEKRGRETLGLLARVITSYPYLGQGALNKPDRDEVTDYRSWVDDLSDRTSWLSWLWATRHRSLSELMKQYGPIDIQRRKNPHEESFEESLEQMKEKGIDVPVELIPRIRRQAEAIQRARETHTLHDHDYGFDLRNVFDKIARVKAQLLPTAQESVETLTKYETKFKLKKRAMWVLSWAVFILVVGITLPMVMNAYAKPPRIKSLELWIFGLTMLPYLIGLIYLIRVVSGLNQP